MNSSNCQKIILKNNAGLVAIHKSIQFESVDFEYYDLMLNEILRALELCSEHVKFSYLDIDIVPNQSWLIMPEFGFGAITYSANSIYISVDTHKVTKQNITKELGAMIAHELNHAARLTTIPIEDWSEMTLLEDAVQEGIAILFQEILYPDSALYINQDVLEQINTWLDKARPLLHKSRSEYNRDEWFYGSDEFPRWVGYTLGYYFAKKYYESKKITLDKITYVPFNEFK